MRIWLALWFNLSEHRHRWANFIDQHLWNWCINKEALLRDRIIDYFLIESLNFHSLCAATLKELVLNLWFCVTLDVGDSNPSLNRKRLTILPPSHIIHFTFCQYVLYDPFCILSFERFGPYRWQSHIVVFSVLTGWLISFSSTPRRWHPASSLAGPFSSGALTVHFSLQWRSVEGWIPTVIHRQISNH